MDLKRNKLLTLPMNKLKSKSVSPLRADSSRKLQEFRNYEQEIFLRRKDEIQRELRELLKKPQDPNDTDYDPRPTGNLAKKVNFYFDCYNKETNLARHMKFTDDTQQQSLGFGKTWKTFYDLVFTMDKDRREGIMEILDKYDEQPQATVKKPTVKKGGKKLLNKKSLFAKWGQVA